MCRLDIPLGEELEVLGKAGSDFKMKFNRGKYETFRMKT